MRFLKFIVACAFLSLAACSPVINNLTPANSSESHETNNNSHAVHWSYDGDTGPEHWGTLGDEHNSYAVCGTGTLQSPIDISASNPQDLPNIAFHYQPRELEMKNNGHTVEVNFQQSGYIELDQQQYQTANIHFHAPSEHTINGESFAAELHLVHTREIDSTTKEYAVVGILLQAGAENPNYQTFLAQLPQQAEQTIVSTELLDASTLLPTTQTSYRYLGSLTTPPCTEGVRWNVLTTPVELSAAQLATLTEVFDHNNRPVQALHQREISQDITP